MRRSPTAVTDETDRSVNCASPVPRPMTVLADAMTAAMLDFGAMTGLNTALAEGPAEPAQLALRTRGDTRLAEEWLRSMVAAGFVTQEGNLYAWTPEARAFLGGKAGFPDLTPGVTLFGALARCVPAVAAAYRAGGQLENSRYPRELLDAMQQMSTQWTNVLLPDVWLPAVPGLVDTLRGGGRVAEIGCASGETLEALATAFPRITAAGFDLDDRLTSAGNARLADHGLAGRVSLETLDATSGLAGEYDLILALSVLHDVRDLPQLLRTVASALSPSGCLLVVESPAVDGPMAAMLLATSVLYCVPTTAARGGEPLGTLGLPPAVLNPLATAAGLSPITTLPAVHPLVGASAFGRSPGAPPNGSRSNGSSAAAVAAVKATGDLPKVSTARLCRRAIALTIRVTVALTHIGSLWLADRLRLGRIGAQTRGTRRIVRHLERLGPTYVKFGQMLSSRSDLFPEHVTAVLGTLHDEVRVMAADEFRGQLELAIRRQPRLRELRLTERCLGSGSIACVYEAVDADGRSVAVKLQRKGIAASMASDLALLKVFTRIAERLPAAGGAPLADLVGYLTRALYGQIDFFREADYTHRLAGNLAGFEGIVVPAVRDEFTCDTALVTDLVTGLTNDIPAGLGARAQGDIAAKALKAVGSMIFRDGFVHCDLHPGNIYARHDGSIVILDAGYCVKMPDSVRYSLRDFFMNVALRNGRRCGEIMYDSAFPDGSARHSAADRREFVSEIAGLVESKTAPGERFDMTDFGRQVFDSQNKFGVHPPADFAFPLMSLMIVEGTLRRWWPDLQIPAATGL